MRLNSHSPRIFPMDSCTLISEFKLHSVNLADSLNCFRLTSVLADGAAFKGFKEAKINFPPTYKYDVGSQLFDTSSKQRAPAYTDRILYKYKLPAVGFRRASNVNVDSHSSSMNSPIKCIAYDSVQSIVSSDHKPVWALFKNTLRPGIDS